MDIDLFKQEATSEQRKTAEWRAGFHAGSNHHKTKSPSLCVPDDYTDPQRESFARGWYAGARSEIMSGTL